MIDTELYDRRPPGGGSAGKRELPVLFHLRDVSRPRVVRPAEVASPPPTVAEPPPPVTTETIFSPASVPASAPLPAAPPSPVFYALEPMPAAPKLNVIQPVAAQPLLPPASPPPDIPPPAETTIAAPPPAEAATASKERSSAASIAAESTTAESATAASTAAEVRPARRFKTPRTEEWFATHGKFIAAGFVLALIGTILLAKTTRKTAPQASHPAHSAPLLASTETSATGDAAIKIDLPAASSNSAVAVTKPVAPSEAPKVELQLPVAAQADASPAATAEKSANGDSLFVFQANNRTEERVAARTDVSPAAANLPSPPPAAAAAPSTGTPPAAYPVTSSPALYQERPFAPTSYPRTSAPMLPPSMPPSMPVAAPPLPPAPSGAPYPGTAMPPMAQGAYVPPGGQVPSTWQPPVGAPPLEGPYQSPETTARGPRYERTGSGNY